MPSVSETNWTIDSMITLFVNGDGLFAQVETNPPQIYFKLSGQNLNASIEFPYVELVNGSLSWFSNSTLNMSLISVPQTSSAQFIKLGSDGHLKICPTLSGQTIYFRQVDDQQPHLGCSENVPLSCGASHQQILLELENITSLSFTPDLTHKDASSCKEACAKNCSCKAAIFQYERNHTNAISLQYLGPASELSVVMIFIVAIVLFIQKRDDNQTEEDYLDQAPGMLNRFAYGNLKTITNEFSKKLGEGGFGSVFEGTLSDGTKVAVKRLDGFGQVKKSFLVEVETIGSIHHVNLVRLVGFCTEKSQRFLIYEYMSNGSLDRWIFHKSSECILDWQQRKNIILDIAKGLNYLHEECRQKKQAIK
ncbi:hypothetical protein EUGRSUZ_K03226 [Eucalyptus grandis]|uniref:Uncharacterized protein n=2 Tax=Eucalyptus grandis TaxID=71139 RepID=A0ACC3IYR5_EUCGR|nr:hypothetical protein EUGRSUZ_K03226 [Eucalyptus grandis]